MTKTTTIPGKSPDQLRRERAQAEFPKMRFQLATVKFRDRETGQPAGQLPICYVFAASGEMYTVLLKQNQPSGCSCMDAKRRGAKCKHSYATEMYLAAGPKPEPEAEQPARWSGIVETEREMQQGKPSRTTPLQRWSARVLETPEERDARILRERDLLWPAD